MKNQYTLDTSGRIIAVGGDWDAHATSTGSPELASEHVIGKMLWDFVSGVETQSYLNAIFFACRMDNQKFSMLCRCDTPEKAQDLRFSVEPQPDETLVVTLEDLVEVGATNRVVNLDDRIDTKRCSICCSFKLGENWIDPMTQPDSRFFAKGFGVCPSCRAGTSRQLHNGDTIEAGQLIEFKRPRSERE